MEYEPFWHVSDKSTVQVYPLVLLSDGHEESPSKVISTLSTLTGFPFWSSTWTVISPHASVTLTVTSAVSVFSSTSEIVYSNVTVSGFDDGV